MLPTSPQRRTLGLSCRDSTKQAAKLTNEGHADSGQLQPVVRFRPTSHSAFPDHDTFDSTIQSPAAVWRSISTEKQLRIAARGSEHSNSSPLNNDLPTCDPSRVNHSVLGSKLLNRNLTLRFSGRETTASCGKLSMRGTLIPVRCKRLLGSP